MNQQTLRLVFVTAVTQVDPESRTMLDTRAMLHKTFAHLRTQNIAPMSVKEAGTLSMAWQNDRHVVASKDWLATLLYQGGRPIHTCNIGLAVPASLSALALQLNPGVQSLLLVMNRAQTERYASALATYGTNRTTGYSLPPASVLAFEGQAADWKTALGRSDTFKAGQIFIPGQAG